MNASDKRDLVDARGQIRAAGRLIGIARIQGLEESGLAPVSSLPRSIKVLLESALRQQDGLAITGEDVLHLARWCAAEGPTREVPFRPARVLLQDFTGVPAVVDLAAMRSAMARLGGPPRAINPLVPVDLVIDHSVQVDRAGSADALAYNVAQEFARNRERYEFLRWGQRAFDRFRVVPPATGIVHQVNLEYLASVVHLDQQAVGATAFPDSLVGTDSHTTMINGLGVLGWGVGGIEAEAVMLGQPISMVMPEVVGMRLDGRLPEGATATDLVLTITELLRRHGVVGKFVEFFGPGLSELSLPDRATVANMAPEYGATVGFFPVDGETLRYLRLTGRAPELVELVEVYCKEQGLFRDDSTPRFTAVLDLDMGRIVPSVAGPTRPQDRVPLDRMKASFHAALSKSFGRQVKTPPPAAAAAGSRAGERDDLYPEARVDFELDGTPCSITHGSVVIAAITSCTNTSNPSVMLGAGLLARKAVARGLTVKPWVKTSLAPGSRVVTGYLDAARLLADLEALRFHVVGYGCTTCIGNSGPLAAPVREAIRRGNLVAAAVLSGNRNFEGRISPDARANYLVSPPLVIAYALAGTVDIDFAREPLGFDAAGAPVYLADIWPTLAEIRDLTEQVVTPDLFRQRYADVFRGSPEWNRIEIAEGDLCRWDPASTYIREPPFFGTLGAAPAPIAPIRDARVLAVLGDSVTTDHISPAGAIGKESPAGQYLRQHGVDVAEFNSYGARRGNHEVMMRGTFANIRIRNQLVPGVEGGFTRHLPSGAQLPIYDAAVRYQREGIALIILAGKEYGSGSSRDWAAKGPQLQGVRTVIAESFERIHRSNLIGMGILPLEFSPGEDRAKLGLTGEELYDIEGLEGEIRPRQRLTVRAHGGGTERRFAVTCRIDTPVEVIYYQNSGILPTVLRKIFEEAGLRPN